MRWLCVLSILLMCSPGDAGAQPSLQARELPVARRDGTIASGALRVRVAYDDVLDAEPPSGVRVAVVGHRADGAVTLVERDAEGGIVELVDLDTSGLTAYQAFALLPRGGRIDRVASSPFILPDEGPGRQVVLASTRRDDLSPPIDVDATSIPRHTVLVALAGEVAPGAPVELVDIETGAVVARGRPARGASHVVLDARAAGDAVVYARTVARRRTYRSAAIPLIADRGARLAIDVAPPFRQGFELQLLSFDDQLPGALLFHLHNPGPAPLAPPASGLEIALPDGARDLIIGEHDRAYVEPSGRGVVLRRPLPPGGHWLHLRFSLPVVDGRAAVALALPASPVERTVVVRGAPGTALADLPAGVSVRRRGDRFELEGVPAGRLRFTVLVPPVDPTRRPEAED